jgi:hypothetical protein
MYPEEEEDKEPESIPEIISSFLIPEIESISLIISSLDNWGLLKGKYEIGRLFIGR